MSRPPDLLQGTLELLLMAGVLAGRPTNDGAAFAAALVVLLAVATLASLAPAWRAARIDPNRALRTE